jgi:hypothetical protein
MWGSPAKSVIRLLTPARFCMDVRAGPGGYGSDIKQNAETRGDGPHGSEVRTLWESLRMRRLGFIVHVHVFEYAPSLRPGHGICGDAWTGMLATWPQEKAEQWRVSPVQDTLEIVHGEVQCPQALELAQGGGEP